MGIFYKKSGRNYRKVLILYKIRGAPVLLGGFPKITRNEAPWMEARKGYEESIPSSELLAKERIMKYYIAVNQKYDINTETGLRTYIQDMLSKAS